MIISVTNISWLHWTIDLLLVMHVYATQQSFPCKIKLCLIRRTIVNPKFNRIYIKQKGILPTAADRYCEINHKSSKYGMFDFNFGGIWKKAKLSSENKFQGFLENNPKT